MKTMLFSLTLLLSTSAFAHADAPASENLQKKLAHIVRERIEYNGLGDDSPADRQKACDSFLSSNRELCLRQAQAPNATVAKILACDIISGFSGRKAGICLSALSRPDIDFHRIAACGNSFFASTLANCLGETVQAPSPARQNDAPTPPQPENEISENHEVPAL